MLLLLMNVEFVSAMPWHMRWWAIVALTFVLFCIASYWLIDCVWRSVAD